MRKQHISRRFSRAAPAYAEHALIQRQVAVQLADRIAAASLPRRPRILEIGCGTGFLTAALASRLGPAFWTITDISPDMLAQAQGALELPGQSRFLVMDGEFPHLPEASFDLICSSMAMQWFDDLSAGLARLARLLAPGGRLMIATLACDTFSEWRRAHTALGLHAAVPEYPAPDAIGRALPGMQAKVATECLRQDYASGLAFLKSLKAIGATLPAVHARPLPATALRRVLAHFESKEAATVTYHLAYGDWEKMPSPAGTASQRGVFVTGTDTGVGKTLVSAILACAWQADYWKPLQTGLSDEAGDTDTVSRLARLGPERIHPPHAQLQAPLAPWAAAALEQTRLNAAEISLPQTAAPLVVEGAGGLFVPIDDTCMMIDLIQRLGLPVVLVARSTLGTINHTLLSLEALRRRDIPVAGVIMSGVLSPGNLEAIERFGGIRVLAQIPDLEAIDAGTVNELAQTMPAFDQISRVATTGA